VVGVAEAGHDSGQAEEGFVVGLYADFQRPSMRANKGGTPAPWADSWYDPISGFMLDGGMRVNADKILTIPPFWRGVKMYTDNMASFPCSVFERLARGIRPAPEHPDAYTLSLQPNPNMDRFQFWGTVMLHCLISKGHFSKKEYTPVVRGGRGARRLDLWPLHPDRVTPKRRPDRVIDYEVRTENGEPKTYGRDEIFHVRGVSMDGLNALVMPSYAASSAGNMLAAERFTSQFYKSGVTAAVQATLKEDLDFGENGLENLRQSIAAYLTGLENAYGVFVAPQTGVELKPIGVDPDKAQLNATREMTAVQACQWLCLPPGTLGDSKTPTYASSKQFREDLVDLSFRPWAECFEAAGDTQLLAMTDPNPMRYFMAFEMDALSRGDRETRSQNNERDIRAGHLTRNEARISEDRQPIDGLDEPVDPHQAAAAPSGNRRGPGARRFERGELVTLQVATQLVRKEVTAASKAAQKFASDGPGWQGWLREFYGTHANEVAERLRVPAPIAKEYASRQGLRLAERGIETASDWEWTVAPELAELALKDYADAA
jgi:HK97 family phage portal protein